MRIGRSALIASALAVALAERSTAQDSAAVSGRHVLPIDAARLQPFAHRYDIVVLTRDSTFTIGRRDIALTQATYAGAPAWLLVETRSGAVAATESLYVSPEMRPIHWSSRLGGARLGAQFVGDSIYGATTSPTGRRNIVLAGRPDLLVSSAMIEALLPLLPLAVGWRDSAGVLAVDLAHSGVIPAELFVIGEEDLAASPAPRASWVVALQTDERYVLFWIDKATGATLRMQHSLPEQGGAVLEFRLRSDDPPPPPTSPH